jgi:hypothetical protein
MGVSAWDEASESGKLREGAILEVCTPDAIEKLRSLTYIDIRLLLARDNTANRDAEVFESAFCSNCGGVKRA